MSLKDDLVSDVKAIFRGTWSTRDGQVVPEVGGLKLGNDAVELDATVLYADMTGSTTMVDSKIPAMAAELYKTYMLCAAKIIKDEGGAITAYDGDRIMAVFIGDYKNTTAAKTALKIKWALTEIVNKEFKSLYTDESYELRHVIGIDTSKLFVCRIGVRVDNDLVWVGRAANYAAKLSSLPDNNTAVYITAAVYNKLADEAKFGGPQNAHMWEKRLWTSMNNMEVYRSIWSWGNVQIFV